MTEATNSVHLAKLRARLHHATITIALQAAMKITKHQLRAQGLKPMYMPHRELRVRAEAYLTAHREELIAEASLVVERWRLEGFFGKRARDAVHITPNNPTVSTKSVKEVQ
jgi:hypothetical protein